MQINESYSAFPSCNPMNSAYFLRQRANANNKTNDTHFEDNKVTLSSYSFNEFLRDLLKAIFRF